jgi:hypothetical protein
MLHSVQFIMRPSPVHCYSKLPVQRSRRSRWFAARFPPAALQCDLSQFKSRVQYRGGQLDQIREPHFRWQRSARAVSYSRAQRLISFEARHVLVNRYTQP